MEESLSPTRYAVLCPEHGRVYLTEAEYRRQLDNADVGWRCPRFVGPQEASDADTIGPCGHESEVDDDTYEGGEQ
jgi:hypothetical protein